MNTITPIEELVAYRVAQHAERRRLSRNAPRRRQGSRKAYKRLNLETLTDAKCNNMFRFTLPQIRRICAAIGLTEPFQYVNSLKVSTELALAMLLFRLSFPRRLEDMADVFGMSSENVSRVVSMMSKLLFEKFKHGLEFDEMQFSKENLERFSRAIARKGAVLKNIVGFIDGTMQVTCRPNTDEEQRVVYNGWKHMHCLKYQAITTPDGITSSLYGPFPGSQNDRGMFNQSDSLTRIASHFERVSPDVRYCIYGDEGYVMNSHLRVPFKSTLMTVDEEYCNKSMSRVRVSVEMVFGKLNNDFKAIKWKPGNRIKQTKPALVFLLAMVFTNFRTIMNGSPVISMFKISPPTLEAYVNRLMRERNENDMLE